MDGVPWDVIKIGSIACCFIGVALYKYIQLKTKPRRVTCEYINDCIFFTEQGINCENKCVVKKGAPCGSNTCNYTNFRKFIRYLSHTARSLDICVFLITEEETCRTIIKLFQRGVFIRIITDGQIDREASSSKVLAFRREYIPLKVISSVNMMHNKFAIIDNRILLVGSFNWTRQASNGNFENAVVTNNQDLLTQYQEYFDLVWDTKN